MAEEVEVKSTGKSFMEVLADAKMLAATIMTFSALMVGSWTLVTQFFVPRAEAEVAIKKLDIETSYNKAFRLEQQLERMDRTKVQRPLSPEEQKTYNRYKRQLDEVDEHIYALENQMYRKEGE